jgi:hypothetical protein
LSQIRGDLTTPSDVVSCETGRAIESGMQERRKRCQRLEIRGQGDLRAQGAVRTSVTLLVQDMGNTSLFIVYTFSV